VLTNLLITLSSWHSQKNCIIEIISLI